MLLSFKLEAELFGLLQRCEITKLIALIDKVFRIRIEASSLNFSASLR